MIAQALAVLLVLLVVLPGSRQQTPDSAPVYLKRGNELYSQALKLYEAKKYTEGNEAKARGIESYLKAIGLNPRLFAAHRYLGDLYLKNTTATSDYQLASDEYKKALEIRPDAETFSRLGITYTAIGKTPEAIPAFEQAARLDATVAMFQYNLGYTYAELGNVAAAQKVQARLQPMDSALGRKLMDKIRKTTGESSLVERPKTYGNPGIELVAIPAGGPVKRGFHLGKYPVTQAQWQAVMGDNPSFFTSCGGTCPVERVSWNDAQALVTRLNQL